MINLLPPKVKSDILYARKNAVLVRWIIAFGILLTSIIVIVIIGQLFINQNKKNQAAQIAAGKEQLKVQKLEETEAKVKSLSVSVKLANDVLSKQVLFSKVITQIGTAMPSGSILTGLSINQLEGGIDLTAAAKDYNTATQVQLNLQNPDNKIFEKADIVSINCSNNSSGTRSVIEANYPCQITVRALFAKNNNFLFINKEPTQ
jgi:Tfp pilus assembly protein PilN